MLEIVEKKDPVKMANLLDVSDSSTHIENFTLFGYCVNNTLQVY